MERILLNIGLFISILFLPWWVSLCLGLVLVVYYVAYETILWALFYDSLYSAPLPEYYGFLYVATLLFFVLVILSVPVKKKMIFYD